MSTEFSFSQIATSDSPLLDVIFVHGLTGDAQQTWTCPEDNTFWPAWLKDDVKHISIYTLGYPTSMFEKWAKKEMDIFERATNVLEHLAAKQIGDKPIAFITHSLGGILTKILLRKASNSSEKDFKQVADSTRLVMFLATPHTGSGLASILKHLPFTSKNIELLANETGFLEDLNNSYRAYANDKSNKLSTKVYYEKYLTKGIATVVTRESADPGVSGTEPVPVDKDHINICKPANKEDIVYLGIKRHIQNTLEEISNESSQANGKFVGANYSKKSDGDRRDLLQKLIDSDREHEYAIANDAQNSFARDYAKTGLFSAARNDHEALLSEVETRFVTHVYLPLICKGASDNAIRMALQSDVIDALALKCIGETKFSARIVLNALYYLTEQCHIRWDPAK